MDNGDISAIISKIVQNPEFAGMVNELRGENGEPPVSPSEILDKLPAVMKTVSPMLDGKTDKDSSDKSKNADEKNSTENFDKVRATKLMQAIKPYLSPERCNIIDKCVSVMQIGDIVKALGITDDLLKRG